MTVLAMVQRPAFVVLGADGAVSGVVMMREDSMRKVAVHERLPLAFSAAGLSDCVGDKGQKMRVVAALAEFAATITEIVNVDSVFERMRLHLDRSFQLALRRGGSAQTIGIHVGLVRPDGAAEAGVIDFDRDGWRLMRPPRGVHYCGTSPAMRHIDRLSPAAQRFDGIDGPDDVAEGVRSLLFDCIAADDREDGGGACGPPVDVVLVDRHGATIVSTSECR